ncbi:MAG: DUF2130 domain-containing protein [Saprospiraceae bacterium]|nr:DUF2130 domain-containing protein [Saprospiraceae bacterium]
MDNIHNITCPNCQHQFDVEQALSGKIQQKLKADFEKEKIRLDQSIAAKEAALKAQTLAFEEKKKKENEIFKEKLSQAIGQKESELKKVIQGDFELKIKAQQEELERRTKQVMKLKDAEIELEKTKRLMQEQAKDIELKLQKQMQEEILAKEELIKKRVQESAELKLKEKDKMLEDQKKLIEEMKRKSEQGSMQLQGEVQELAIEEFLQTHFPFDLIEEIKKGARGGDCVQVVQTRDNANCGKIYYESKRTKEFQPAWIEKFKTDIRRIGADVGVLVTQAYPKNMTSMGQLNGIWICSFREFKSLCFVLRDSIIKIAGVKASNLNKGDKMELLYNYMTSNEFKLQVEGIVEGFTQMQNDLQKEKNAMQKIWNQREKQIQKVLHNTKGMYGSIKGLAGNAIGTIDSLELGS